LARLFAVAQKTTLAIGVVGCSWSAGCAALWGEVYWPIRDQKKVRPKNCMLRRRFIKT
jgi:hypothetical protein